MVTPDPALPLRNWIYGVINPVNPSEDLFSPTIRNEPKPVGVQIDMHWRRGLIFAVIHLAIAIPIVTTELAQRWSNIPQFGADFRGSPAAIIEYSHPGPRVTLVRVINFPAALAVGWPWDARTFLNGVFITRPRRAEILMATIFLLAIASQWFLVGGIRVFLKLRWFEPANVLTAIAVVAACALPFSIAQKWRGAPLMMMFICWLLWVALAVVRPFRSVRSVEGLQSGE